MTTLGTLRDIVNQALSAAVEAGDLVSAQAPDGMVVERPKDEAHGHLVQRGDGARPIRAQGAAADRRANRRSYRYGPRAAGGR